MTILGNHRKQAEDNLAALTQQVHDKYTAGSLSLANYTNPTTLMNQYATKYNGSGYYVDAEATAAAAGFATPNLNQTSTITVSAGGNTYTGALLSQHALLSGSWTVGATYNASQMSGLQEIATMKGRFKTLTGDSRSTPSKTRTETRKTRRAPTPITIGQVIRLNSFRCNSS